MISAFDMKVPADPRLLLMLTIFCRVSCTGSGTIYPGQESSEIPTLSAGNDKDAYVSAKCGPGHVCGDLAGAAHSLCVSHCPLKLSPVCGSDGVIYPNRCYLHRRGCLSRSLIRPLLWRHCNVSSLHSRLMLSPNQKTYFGNEKRKSMTSSTVFVTGRRHDNAVATHWKQKLRQRALSGRLPPGSTNSSIRSDGARPISAEDSSRFTLSHRYATEKVNGWQEQDANDVTNWNAQQKPNAGGGKICSYQQYKTYKDILLSYMRRHLSRSSHSFPVISSSAIISSLFSRIDLNMDGYIEADEFDKFGRQRSLAALNTHCLPRDMLHFDDSSRDSRLDLDEFFRAFSSRIDVTVVSLDKKLELIRLTANEGDNVEIRCDIYGTPAPKIVWKRSGVGIYDEMSDHLRVFADGSLYLSSINQNLAGNYTCHTQPDPGDIFQTHVLHVNSFPKVWLNKPMVWRNAKYDTTVRCHSAGVPEPKLFWLHNGVEIGSRPSMYTITGDGTSLLLKSGAASDLSGRYTCQAKNAAGTASASTLVLAHEEPNQTNSARAGPNLAVFHSDGLSIYEAVHCRLLRELLSTDHLSPETRKTVCRGKCVWGDSVYIGENRLYASQPEMDRILLIDTLNATVVDVVNTDRFPVKLHYLHQQDQLWVLSGSSLSRAPISAVQVVRNASMARAHHTVHLRPVEGRLNHESGLLLLPSQKSSGNLFEYGYVTHSNQTIMYKLRLDSLSYVQSSNLSVHNCVPAYAQFASLFGYVVIGCTEAVTSRPTGQILYDQLTDAVIQVNSDVIGRPLLTPDSLLCVTYHVLNNESEPGGVQANGYTLITVQKVTDAGLNLLYQLRTPLAINDVTIDRHPESRDYQMIATSYDTTDLLLLNLVTGKIEIMPLTSYRTGSMIGWNREKRPITSAGGFHSLVATTNENTLYIADTHKMSTTCQIGGFSSVAFPLWLSDEEEI